MLVKKGGLSTPFLFTNVVETLQLLNYYFNQNR